MPNELKILINTASYETRIAVIEAGVLQELNIERSSASSLVGNIYKAKVVRVIPGMQAAFVDIGLQKNGFLHIDDICNNISAENKNNTSLIQNQLHQGETIWVQVSKDPYSDKGARLTSRLSISSRNLIYTPLSEDISVSNKITSKQEQIRLKELVDKSYSDLDINGGFIVRTLAEGADFDEIKRDMLFLHKTWIGINNDFKSKKSISVVHNEVSLLIRTLREVEFDLVDSIWIDSQISFNLADKFISDFMPELKSKIHFYSQDKPLFDLYSVEQQIQAALKPIVKLNNGGHLIIEQTAAMTVIDVNSGSYLGNKDQHETVLKVNLEAVNEIVKQLRLRNLCGIIVIDFIDMTETQHHKQVLKRLENCLEKDKVRTSFSNFSSLGLVEISRQRTSESLEQILCEKCEICDGSSSVKTNQTICYDILRDILQQNSQFEANSFTVTTSSEIIEIFENNEAGSLSGVQQLINVPINFNPDQQYQRQYEIALN